MRLCFAVLVAFASLATGCSHVSPSAANAARLAQHHAFSRHAEVIFTPADWPKALAADIYQPQGAGPWPAVLLIYGGSWSAADHRWQMSLLARKLAQRGFVVMNASYRGSPAFLYPAARDDLREALRWLRGHAGDYQLDPQRVAAYGFSAGGHLAALLGTLDAPREERVQAVVAASAPLDLTLYPGGEILPRFLGATYAQDPARFKQASPITHVSGDDPPMFLYHGTDDKTVSPEHSRRFKAALDRAGVPNQLHWVEGRGHATTLIFGGDIEDAAIDFLAATLQAPVSSAAR